MSRQDYLWAAGLADGKISVRASRGRVELRMADTRAQLLEHFARAIGEGRVIGPYSGTYRWYCGVRAGRRVLERIGPYMRTDRVEAMNVALGVDTSSREGRQHPSSDDPVMPAWVAEAYRRAGGRIPT